MKKVLVFAPHPDDEMIGCGGTLALHAQKGDQVTVVFVTSGEAAALQADPSELARTREQEAKDAGEVLGFQTPQFLRVPDGYVSYTPEVLKKMLKLVREQKPDIVYMPHAQEGHRDHRMVHELALEAVNRAGAKAFGDLWTEAWTVPTILGYEVWTPLTEYQLVVDISSVIDQKIKALQKHASQMKAVKYDEAARSLSRYRGVLTQVGDYAECFQVLKIPQMV